MHGGGLLTLLSSVWSFVPEIDCDGARESPTGYRHRRQSGFGAINPHMGFSGRPGPGYTAKRRVLELEPLATVAADCGFHYVLINATSASLPFWQHMGFVTATTSHKLIMNKFGHNLYSLAVRA